MPLRALIGATRMPNDQHDKHCHDMLTAALEMAADGFLIFPCLYQTKKPATPSGFYNASTNPKTIERWFGGSFRRNLAARTGLASGAWVLDADDPESLTALEARHGQCSVRSYPSRRARNADGARPGRKCPDAVGACHVYRSQRHDAHGIAAGHSGGG
jgi:hypothetical protein